MRPLMTMVFALLLGITGCASARPVVQTPGGDMTALRVSQWSTRGDAQRRASTRMVLEGLDVSDYGREAEAVAGFERAIQVDPSNPLAYLAYARHEAFHGDPARALQFLDKAEATFGRSAEGMHVLPHLRGLRGVALKRLRRAGGSELVEAARREASVWTDGRLDAAELR